MSTFRNVQHIQGIKFWEMLEQKVTSPATHVRFTHCRDIYPSDYPTFPECKLLMIDSCDKNFFYYWFHRRVFPKVENIWINNHPCAYDMHVRFSQPIFTATDIADSNPPFIVPTMFIVNTYKYRYFTATKSSHYTLPRLQFIEEPEYETQIQKFNQELQTATNISNRNEF
jgi:hypothetical protein